MAYSDNFFLQQSAVAPQKRALSESEQASSRKPEQFPSYASSISVKRNASPRVVSLFEEPRADLSKRHCTEHGSAEVRSLSPPPRSGSFIAALLGPKISASCEQKAEKHGGDGNASLCTDSHFDPAVSLARRQSSLQPSQPPTSRPVAFQPPPSAFTSLLPAHPSQMSQMWPFAPTEAAGQPRNRPGPAEPALAGSDWTPASRPPWNQTLGSTMAASAAAAAAFAAPSAPAAAMYSMQALTAVQRDQIPWAAGRLFGSGMGAEMLVPGPGWARGMPEVRLACCG